LWLVLSLLIKNDWMRVFMSCFGAWDNTTRAFLFNMKWMVWILVSLVGAMTTNISPQSTECYFQTIAGNETLTLSYQVEEDQDNVGKDDDTIHFVACRVYAPHRW
jgi:hypothetical protein